MRYTEYSSFRDACIKAYAMLKKDNFVGFYLVVDIGDMWVFFGGNPDETYYGVRTVSVEKPQENVSGSWHSMKRIMIRLKME